MILITGSNGYVGSHICYFFDKNKINYIGIDNNSYSYSNNNLKKNKNFKIDIFDLKKIDHLIKKYKINTVIHAAAYSYVIEGEKNKKKYFLNNIKKTKLFINFCKKKNIDNFIFLSSSNVYYENKNKNQFSEKDKLGPKNYYGKNKLIIEKFLKKKNFKHLRILRLFNIIGIHNRNFKFFKINNNYQRLIFQIQKKIEENKVVKLRYFLKNKKKFFPSRDFIDVKIVYLTIEKLIKNFKKNGKKIIILNVGSGKAIPINILIKKLKKYAKKKFEVKLERINNKELLITKANNSNLKKFLKKKINFNLNETIKSHFF